MFYRLSGLIYFILVFTFYLNPYDNEYDKIMEDWNDLIIHYDLKINMESYQMERRRAVVREKAREMAIQYAASHLENLIVDNRYRIHDFLKTYEKFSAEYAVFLMNRDMSSFYFQGNYINTGLKINIRGKEGLLHTIPLPWNQEKYGDLMKEDINSRYYETSSYFPVDREAVAPEYYDSLVVDVTELEITPALAPRIYTDSGRLIYGPEFLRKKYAIERGVVTYITEFKIARKNSRQGKNPFISVALAVKGKNHTDVVISEKDAATFFSQKSNIENLLKCRVIFLIKNKKTL